jgi:hypothetical protein
MGAIICKGEYYGGSDVIEITQADYNALSSEQKNNGTLYVIKDAPSIIDIIYPVGSIYMSVNNVNPGTYLNGTSWEIWGSGRVPVGVSSDTEFNTVEKTGGEKAHTLTTAEMPSHYHDELHWGSSTSRQFGVNHGSSNIKNPQWYFTYASVSSTAQANFYSGNTGGNGSHNNLQPYITCYMWKRTH